MHLLSMKSNMWLTHCLPSVVGAVMLAAHAWFDPWLAIDVPTVIALSASCSHAAHAIHKVYGWDESKTFMDLFGLLRYATMAVAGGVLLHFGWSLALLRVEMVKWAVEIGVECSINHGKPEADLMKVHHLLTMALILAAVANGNIDLGARIAWVHDASDVLVSATKFAHHHGNMKLASEVLFALMVGVVWPYSRLWWLPHVILENDMLGVVTQTLLWLLVLMQAYWWVEMLRIAYRLAVKGKTPEEAASKYYAANT